MLIGEKFGKWTLVSFYRIRYRDYCYLKCECGALSQATKYHVLKGYTKACKKCAAEKHGHYGSPTNRAWNQARNRCYNPKNKDFIHYGGRGIIMHDRWNKFENFLEDMGEKPEGLTLDRINNNGNYEPGNCRWATYSQQNKNQRKRRVKEG